MLSVSEVQTEIEERLRSHAEALARRDTDAALELFSSDAVVKLTNVEPIRGAAALREFFERAFESISFGAARFFTEELYLYDSLAFHFGMYELTSMDPSGQNANEKGGFAIVWRQQRDGSWRYHRGVLNGRLVFAGGP
jgi:ketosteroid isomerase-like protein